MAPSVWGGVINILTILQFQVMLKSEEEFMKLAILIQVIH